MADEVVVTSEAPTESTCCGGSCHTKGVTKGHAVTIHEEVNRSLSTEHAKTVRERVILHLVEEKLQERKNMVIEALGKLRTQRQEVEQLKRKGEQKFGLDKKPIGDMVYTKQQAEEFEKAFQKAEKLEKALDKAIGEGDYSKLQECIKS